MTAVSSILAGARITAAMLQGIAPNAAFKGASQQVTGSTLTNDDTLFLPLTANAKYIFFGLLDLTSSAAIQSGDFKGQFTVPSGATLIVEAIGYMPSGTAGAGPLNGNAIKPASSTYTIGVNGSTASPGFLIGSVVVGATAGNLQLQWGPNTTTTTATINVGSFLAAWQIA